MKDKLDLITADFTYVALAGRPTKRAHLYGNNVTTPCGKIM